MACADRRMVLDIEGKDMLEKGKRRNAAAGKVFVRFVQRTRDGQTHGYTTIIIVQSCRDSTAVQQYSSK